LRRLRSYTQDKLHEAKSKDGAKKHERNSAVIEACTLLLERHIIIRQWPAAEVVKTASTRTTFGLGSASAPTTTKELYTLRDNLGNVALVPFFVVIAARANCAFDVHLTSFGKILTAVLGLLAPDNDIVPLGLLLSLSTLICPRVSSGKRKFRHCLSAGGEAHLGIFT